MAINIMDIFVSIETSRRGRSLIMYRQKQCFEMLVLEPIRVFKTCGYLYFIIGFVLRVIII